MLKARETLTLVIPLTLLIIFVLPYTRMLLDALPDLEMSGRPRIPVAGEVPNPLEPPAGCAFHPRCPHADDRCRLERPELKGWHGGSPVACHAVEDGRLQS